MSRGEIVEKHSQMVGKGMDLNYAVMELADPTGGIGVMRRLAKQRQHRSGHRGWRNDSWSNQRVWWSHSQRG